MPSIDAAEKLLRIALFSDSLQLTAADDRTDNLIRTRQELARVVRIGRKRGVVGVFLSKRLFVIALAISVYGAFSRIGNNETAHVLGIGLLLSWLPILVLSSITDRNPVATDEIRQQLNNFVNLARTALLDTERRESYIKTIGKTEDKFAWTKLLEDDHHAFFIEFAGQGRVRWHVGSLGTLIIAELVVTSCQHGCANSILSSMENAWIADAGRGWMDDPDQARTRMIDVDPNHRELIWLDRQMFWQIACSTALLYGTAGGAFILACENTTRQPPVHPLLIRFSLHSHYWHRLLVRWVLGLHRRRYLHLCNRNVAVVVSSNISRRAAMDPLRYKETPPRLSCFPSLWTCTTYLRTPKQ